MFRTLYYLLFDINFRKSFFLEKVFSLKVASCELEE